MIGITSSNEGGYGSQSTKIVPFSVRSVKTFGAVVAVSGAASASVGVSAGSGIDLTFEIGVFPG